MKLPKKMRQRRQNPPPRNRLGLTGLEYGWRRMNWGWRRVNCRAYSSRYSFWTPFSFVSSCSPFSSPSAPCPWSHSGFLISYFLVLGAMSITSGQLPLAGGRVPAARGWVPGSQRPSKSRVCSGQVKVWRPLLHPAGGQDWARVLHVCWPALSQEAQACTNCNGLKPKSPRLQSQTPSTWAGGYSSRPNTPDAMIMMPSHSITVRLRGTLRDPHPPMPSFVPMCTMPIWAQNCHVLSSL